MSVFTSIDEDELNGFLANYALGALRSYAGIPSGTENTNYFVTTEQGEFVLTLFEQLAASEIPFFLDLTAYLAEHAIPSAHPVRNNAGSYLGSLKGKPAALVQRLRGHSLVQPEARHCAAVGAVLARLNTVGQGFPQNRPNRRGPHWWRKAAHSLYGHINPEDADLIREELRFQASHRLDELPRGIVHADLFRDNVLFENDTLYGLIDFYYACTDVLLFDVAVTVNDWCSAPDGVLDVELARTLLDAYHQVRPVSAAERAAWPVMLRAAALRFWLSRLYDLHFPRPGEITHTKDPDVFRRILVDRVHSGPEAIGLWPDAQKKRAPG